MIAKEFKKPFYVAAESHKMTQLFPLTQADFLAQMSVPSLHTPPELDPESPLGIPEATAIGVRRMRLLPVECMDARAHKGVALRRTHTTHSPECDKEVVDVFRIEVATPLCLVGL